MDGNKKYHLYKPRPDRPTSFLYNIAQAKKKSLNKSLKSK